MIMQSVAFFMVFQSVRIQSKAVNAIAGCSFGVYLLHTNFFRYVRIEQYVTGSIFLIPVHILLAALWIYGVSAVIYAVYQKTLGFLIGRGLSRLHFLKYEVN